jgi:WD40 repeat protein
MQLRPLTKNDGKCTGLISIQKPSLFVTAWLDGELNVFNDQLECVNSIDTPWKNITSLHASPDGAFLALGSRENGISLWDLRITDFAEKWNLPISMQSAGWITLLNQWHTATNVSSQSRKWVRLIQSCLQYFYRYEVQIDLLPHVKPGAYDILL